MLNTNRLRILREVHARGTISAAADALYLTPPAVSHQLAVLEREVGVGLLERTARSVKLTDAGELLVQHAETILAECETALADVAWFSEQLSASIQISTFQTASQTVALPAVLALRDRHPRLTLTVRDMEPWRAIPALKAGQLDIALTHEWDLVPTPADPGLDRFELMTEQIVVLLPKDHPLADGPVRLAQLANEPWCVAHESAMSRQAFERVAQAAGFEPRIALESNYFRAIGSAVEVGLGVGIAPLLTDFRSLDIAVQPLIEPAMTRRIVAVVRKGSGGSPAMSAVLDAFDVAAAAATVRMVDAKGAQR